MSEDISKEEIFLLPGKRVRRAPVRKKPTICCTGEANEAQTKTRRRRRRLCAQPQCTARIHIHPKPTTPSNESQSNDAEETTDDKTKKRKCDRCLYCNDHCKSNKTTRKGYDCRECKIEGTRRTFASSEKLMAHIKDVHDYEDSKLAFCCQECKTPTWFPSKAKYHYHLAARHPGVIHFVCEICAAIFKLKANYKMHMAGHNIQPKKQFSCEVCRGTFVNKAGLESHVKRFPGPHIKQVCAHCGFSFSREKHMINHRCKKLLLEEAAVRAAEETAALRLRTEEPTQTNEMAEFYRQIPVVAEEPIVIQELPEVSNAEQIIIPELIVPSSQVLHFDLSDGLEQTQQVYHVNVADWNVVAPYVIRDTAITENSVQ